ncbi:MAG: transporter [Pirellulaceae bacterium]|nr:MAG: transporter [Pirellulaceae bacterium]
MRRTSKRSFKHRTVGAVVRAQAWFAIGLVFLTGCHPTQPFYFHNDGDLSHYLDRLQTIDYPDVDHARLAEVTHARPPLNVADPNFDSFWDLSLEEVISIALQNSKVIRNLGAVTQFGVADGLLNRTAASATVYDPAISETNTLSGPRPVDRSTGSLFLTEPQAQATQQGVEDALSEFDAQFFSSLTYSTTDRPRNVQAGNPFNPLFFQQNSGQYLATLSKKTATGALFSLRNRTTYTWNNIPIGIGRALPSDWQTEFEIEAQIPLLRGAGAEVNRIPILLARINTDISLADFEAAVRNLLMDIENTYWDLYAAYRALETARIGRDSAQVVWRNTYAKLEAGTEGTQREAQTREQYFFFRAQLETAQHELFETEARLRWLMGLSSSDGRVIRPKDEPTLAEVHFDWQEILTEALIRSPELRQQKWRIKQRELELVAAKNQLLPRLNGTLLYRWVGVGDELINADRNGLNFPSPGSTAFDELTEGNFQEALMGLEFTPPQFGARRPLAAIRNAQLQLARAKAQLEEMELQQTHLLSSAWRNVKFRYALAVSHFDRWAASQADVESATALFERGKENLDIVLDAQRRRAQSQIDFYRALAEYNKAIAEVHFRKGSLLEYNGIQLAEGPWPQKAYWDALEKARQRDSSYYLRWGTTQPAPISRGPVDEEPGYAEPMPEEVAPETIPAPEPHRPTPAEPSGPAPTPARPGPVTQRSTNGTMAVQTASYQVPASSRRSQQPENSTPVRPSQPTHRGSPESPDPGGSSYSGDPLQRPATSASGGNPLR